MDGLSKIYSDIREVKIQGASNIAKAAIKAYSMRPDDENRNKLLGLRPTEPTLANALNYFEKNGKKKTIEHFNESQEKINEFVLKMLKNRSAVYTHCHSTSVVKSLIYAKKKGKKFEVFNTETRPLFQGRKTARELSKAGIKVTTFVDSAIGEAVKKADVILLGADAILKSGAINKIGSGTIAELASIHKKKVFIVADSWKFSSKSVPIEERDFHEVWKNAPSKIKIRNPAFEMIEKKYISGIISELGDLSFEEFINLAERNLD